MESTAYKATAPSSGKAKWFYFSGGKKLGPVDESKLLSMLESGALPAQTKVWTQGMEGWLPASETALANNTAGPSVVANLNKDAKPAKKGKSRWWIWLIVALVVVAAAAVACYFLFFRNASTPEPILEEEIVYSMQESVIFENDQCAFVIDAVGEKGDYLELDVRCVNKTGDVLSFVWDSTCINGSMFDPLWSVYVQGNSTMRSSITFPLRTLQDYPLLPANQIKFVLRVHNENQFHTLTEESATHLLPLANVTEETVLSDYQQIKGYEGYLFTKNVKVDEDGRPYYLTEDETAVYFDEIYDLYGQPLYTTEAGRTGFEGFYNDPFGRPYYFSQNADTVYYDGYGYAFYDEASGKHYFYDENGIPAYYGNGGIPEYYEGSAPTTPAEKPESLAKAGGNYIVHKEFCIYPTGKQAEDVTKPERITATSELVYWDGDKGNFIVLGGETDAFKGYIVHTYLENDSDSYVYFGWDNVVVNGVAASPDTITVLRPHSSAYRDIIIPAQLLKDNKIKVVEQIDFSVYAVGENLSVPLYPIEWTAIPMVQVKK